MTADGSAGEQGPPRGWGPSAPEGSGPDGSGPDGSGPDGTGSAAHSEPARLESPGFEEIGAWPVDELLTEMATGAAAPACGSAAAVAAGLSAALAGKVARRSRARLAEAEHLIGRTDELRRRATELAGADAAAVHAMVTFADMPETARAVPEEIRDLAAELAQVAARLAAHGRPALHADAVGAGRLAEAARAAAEAILASNSPG